MKVLVTGGAGFVARHLTKELRESGHEVFLTDVADLPGPDFLKADLMDARRVDEVVRQILPDAVMHLGAISFVPDAAKDPGLLKRINLGGTEHLLDAVSRHVPASKFLFVSTALVLSGELSPYAAMKLAAEGVVAQFGWEGHRAVIARPANHTGPGQSPKFVVPAFVRQALEIRRGERELFTVGNLDSVRDFTDVRDVVRAYRMLVEAEDAKGVYSICSDCRMTIGELLAKIASQAGVPATSTVDAALWRPTDIAQLIDTTRIKSLGWRPEIPLERTISDMIGAEFRP